MSGGGRDCETVRSERNVDDEDKESQRENELYPAPYSDPRICEKLVQWKQRARTRQRCSSAR